MTLRIKERRRSRFHAIQALYQKNISFISIEDLKKQYYEDNYRRYSVDWLFFSQIIEGSIKNLSDIDKEIYKHISKGKSHIAYVDLSILRLGSYELKTCKMIPYQVILSEYVIHSRILGSNESYSFINAMLQTLAKKYRNL